MNKERLRRDLVENTIYVVLWAILFAAPLLMEYVQMTHEDTSFFNWHHIHTMWKVFALYLIAFLIHNFLIAPVLLYRHKLGRYAVFATLLLATFTIAQCSVHPQHDMGHKHMEHREPSHRDHPDERMTFTPGNHQTAAEPFANDTHQPPAHMKPHRPDGRPPFGFIQNEALHVFILFLIFGMNLGVKLYFKNERDRKKMHLLKNRSMEQQLESLRYQINPHFFMNTLNNIHALIDIDPTHAKQTVVELSRLMRYVLYDSSAATVSLQRDIAFMEDYIRLMRIRYDKRVDITTDFPAATSPDGNTAPDLTNNQIPPMLFISFIENAFKHGVSYQEKSFIDIQMRIDQEHVIFSCRNSRHENSQPKEKGGVGLANVRQRLSLLYADSYTLDTTETEKEYAVSVVIPRKMPSNQDGKA